MSDNIPTRPEPPVTGQSSSLSAPSEDFAGGLEPAGQLGEEGFSFARYLGAILRYKWLVLACGVLGFGAGLLFARMQTTSYEVEATLWLEPTGRQQPKADDGPVGSTLLFPSSGAWLELIKSPVVIDPVVERMRLHIRALSPPDTAVVALLELDEQYDPGMYRLAVGPDGRTFQLSTHPAGELRERGSVGDSIGRGLGFRWAPPAQQLSPGRTIDFVVRKPSDVSRSIGGALTTRLDGGGSFMRVKLSGPNPQATAERLNAIVEHYVEETARLKSAKYRELAELLREQLDHATRNLREAEEALGTFRVKTITLPSEATPGLSAGLEMTDPSVFQDFFALKMSEEQVRRDREAIRRLVGAVPDSGLSVAALEAIPSVSESSELAAALTDLTDKRAELRTLRLRYSDAHPAVAKAATTVRQLEERTIPQLALGLIRELGVRQSELQKQISSASASLQEIPSRSIEEARLVRRVETAAGLTQQLQTKYEEARLAIVSTGPDLRILTPAMAGPAVVSDPRILLAMGILGGLGLGLAGAVLIDRIDPRLRYPVQISSELGLPILGTVPHLKGKNGRFSSAMSAEAVEAFRNIRLSLVHACGRATPIVITISSPGVGEGKSLVASNLAVSFANMGAKTLLVDGDMRRGNLHRVFGAVRKPGLFDHLAGTVDSDAVVQGTGHPKLHFIGSGSRSQTSPEVLQSSDLTGLVTRLRSKFDLILVDSPPLAAGVDAFVLATATGNLLLVVRSGATNRELTEAKLDLIDRLPIRLLGAVLNDVPPRGVYGYYSYLREYETRGEEVEPHLGRILRS